MMDEQTRELRSVMSRPKFAQTVDDGDLFVFCDPAGQIIDYGVGCQGNVLRFSEDNWYSLPAADAILNCCAIVFRVRAKAEAMTVGPFRAFVRSMQEATAEGGAYTARAMAQVSMSVDADLSTSASAVEKLWSVILDDESLTLSGNVVMAGIELGILQPVVEQLTGPAGFEAQI